METATMITLSTAHVRPEDMKWLGSLYNEEYDVDLVVYPKIMRVSGEDYNVGWFIFPWCLMDSNIPKSILDCLNFARKNDCGWLMLDANADIEPSLPVYDWP